MPACMLPLDGRESLRTLTRDHRETIVIGLAFKKSVKVFFNPARKKKCWVFLVIHKWILLGP
jgi:hypothetical protein